MMFRMMLVSVIGLLGCKMATKSKTAEAEKSFQIPPELSGENAVSSLGPRSMPEESPVEVPVWTAKFPGLKAIAGELQVRQLPSGESLLLAQDGFGLSPVASTFKNQYYEWYNHSAEIQGANGTGFASVNVAMRTPVGGDPLGPEAVPYMVYRDSQGMPMPISIVDHIALPTTLARNGNSFLDAKGVEKFKFSPIQKDVWKVQGPFYSGFACPGSIIAKSGNALTVITKEFGDTKASRWLDDDGVMRLIEPSVKLESISESHIAQASECPFNNSSETKSMIEKIEYDNPTNITQSETIVDFRFDQDYPTGTRVRFPTGTIWTVAESYPKINTFYLLNHSVTTASDKGQRLASVYRLTPKQFPEFKPEYIGSTASYLVSKSLEIDQMSDQRIEHMAVVAEFAESARTQLKIAEVKARSVGSGLNWDGISKVTIQIISNIATDALLNPELAGKGASAFGMKATGISVKKAVTSNSVELRKRMTALFFVVMIEGLTTSSQVVAAKLADGKPYGAAKAAGEGIGATSLVQGLRCLAALTPTKLDDPILMFGSGVAMRYRRLDNDAKLGYETNNSIMNPFYLGNLLVGGATAFAELMAINRNSLPGRVKAIQKGGALVSELIAGRGYPAVIIGNLVEIGADALIPVSIYRPFLVTGAAQMNAIIQLGGAQAAASEANSKIDDAIEVRKSQLKKIDAMIYILRMRPNSFDELIGMERNLVISTLKDPFKRFRARQP